MFSYEHWGMVSLPARENLALEEYFFRRPASTGKAVVRFFDVPCDGIVLGYGQAADSVKTPAVDVVRRLTGGSHVQLGTNTLAYSIAVPRDGSFAHYEDMRAYYADTVTSSLERLGLEAVADNRASTITIHDRVVASHALIWGVESALLHGLIVLSPYDVERLAGRVFLKTRMIGGASYSERSAIRNIPALSLLLQKDPRKLKSILAEAILANVAGGKHENHAIGEPTLREARGLQAQKYAGEAWTHGRRPPFTADEVESIPGEELAGALKTGLGYCFYSQVPDKDFKKMADPSEPA